MEVERAIARGSKRMQDGKIVVSYGHFEVVYVQKGENIQIITVHLR